MRNENMNFVDKVWGGEIWVVNRKEYCGKILVVDQSAEGSYHFHKNKIETFYVLVGSIRLIVNGAIHDLTENTPPVTIHSGDKHQFIGLKEAMVLEISTHHNNNDVVRLSESKAGKPANVGCTGSKPK